jgi:hypothetical protein
MVAFVGNTNLLEIRGLKSAVEGTFINDATVSVTVKDASGAAITGQTWPTAMIYVAASQGDYRAVIEDDAALTARQTYTAEITVNAGVNRIGFWKYVFKPQDRTK